MNVDEPTIDQGDPKRVIPKVRAFCRVRPLTSTGLARLKYLHGAESVERALARMLGTGELTSLTVIQPQPFQGVPATKVYVPAAAEQAQRAYWAATGAQVTSTPDSETPSS